MWTVRLDTHGWSRLSLGDGSVAGSCLSWFGWIILWKIWNPKEISGIYSIDGHF